MEERLVYQVIFEGGRKGVWTRDIRSKAGLTTAKLNKIVRTLENKRIIKSTKWPEQPRKRIYMLYHLREEVGFFQNPETRELDADLIQAVADRCYHVIKQKVC
jgi:DNA-directed RNA polymerase III subunit RPC6